MQSGRAGSILDASRFRWNFFFLSTSSSGRGHAGRILPRALANERAIIFQRAYNGEQSLGNSTAFRFINRSAIQSHGNRISLIGARIKKIPVVHNGDGNEVRLAARREFEQPHRARAFIGLDMLFVLRMAQFRKGTNRQYRRPADDAPQPCAV